MIQKSENKLKEPVGENEIKTQVILDGASNRAVLKRIKLGANAVWYPELVQRPQMTQIFLFTGGTGYVSAGGTAYNITEPARFIPDFDKEKITIKAGQEGLECIEIKAAQNKEDAFQINKSHLVFPNFRPLSKAWECNMANIGNETNVCGFILIENRKYGANKMGFFISEKPGPCKTREDSQIAYDQYVIAMEGADFSLTMDDETVDMREGDIALIPRTHKFTFSCGQEGKIHHVWYSLNRAYDE